MPMPMLVLALVTWLAASTPEAATRIPGTRLKLGMSEAQVLEMGAFAEVKVADAAGMSPRKGPTKFFGVPCEATLYFRNGFLERARLEGTAVSPHMQDYVESQLQRAKMFRECTRLEPGDHSCDWLGDVKIHLEFLKDKMDARVERPPQPWETEAEPVAATPPATATPSAPVSAMGAVASAPPPGIVTAPGAVPKAASESSTSPPAAPPSTSPTTTKTEVAPAHAIEPVPVLPETLRLSLPGRPTEWPRMTHVPPLSYPEDARRESVQGVVWVLALVDADGTVRSASIDRGIKELNDAAVAWAKQARFEPCVRDGKPCRFWIRLATRFTLH